MKLLITGCGRSGTKWMADCLQAAGVDCGHEIVWNERYNRYLDWIAESSAYAAPYTRAFKDTLMKEVYTVHLVRHPLHMIESAVWRGGVLKRSKYAARWIPELERFRDKVKQAAYYWVAWNKLVYSQEWIRVEDVNEGIVRDLAARVSLEPDYLPSLPEPSNVSDRSRERRMVGWNQVDMVPDLMRLATQYGYLPE